MHSPSILLNAALGYGARGWRVVPLHTPTGEPERPCSCGLPLGENGLPQCKVGKHPRIREWPETASTDEAQIRRWWGMWPEANVGIACGEKTGWWALDSDGDEGLVTLAKLEAANSPLPPTVEQVTGGGGSHRLFLYVPGLKNAVKFAPGLDVRTDGGLIVVEPSLHECGREYAWNAEAHPDEVFLAEAPGWLLTAIKRAGGKERVPVGAGTAGPILQGSRNDTLFRDGCAMRRRGMSEATIRAALLQENEERCQPPLPAADIERLASSSARYAPGEAGTNGTAADHGTPPPAASSSAPLNSLNSLNSSASENTFEPEWPAPLAPEAFYGRAGEIVQEIAPESEADESALLVNLLAMFGNAVGRNPHAKVGPTRHGANLFAVLVGHTGGARKGTSHDPILELFERALPGYPEAHIKGSIASGEGLVSLVRDRQEKKVQVKNKKTGRMTMDYDTVVEDEGVPDKRLLIVDSEMSGMLKVMNRSGNILSEQLRKAWETGTLDNSNKNSPLKATGAHISVLGHITPDALKRHLTESEAANGFGNRFLWMACKRSKSLPEGGNLPPLNRHVSALRELVEIASGKIMIGRDDCARAIWAAVYDDLTAEGVGMFGELTARRAPIVLRLSLVYALWDGIGLISAEHLLAALAVWERSEDTVRFLFGDATGDPAADALYDAMNNRPEGATRTDLHKALGNNRPVAEVDRALTALQRSQKARMQRQKGEGNREVEAWYACSPSPQQQTGRYLVKARAALAEWNNEQLRI